MSPHKLGESRLIALAHEAREEFTIGRYGGFEFSKEFCRPACDHRFRPLCNYSPLGNLRVALRLLFPHFPDHTRYRLVSLPSLRHNPVMSDNPIQLSYDRGTVVVTGGPAGFDFQSLSGVVFDPRTSSHRAQGRHYRAIVEQLIREKRSYEDTARGWPAEQTGWKLNAERAAREYQSAAVAAWGKTRRGGVVMPTG